MSEGIGKAFREKRIAGSLLAKAATPMTSSRWANHAYFVRSPHAHADVVNIDVEEALAAPGVIAVLTGADVTADGLAGYPAVG